METKYAVRTRYGWGFEVVGENLKSYPFESAITAQSFADFLNEGWDAAVALKRIRQFTDFRNGRFYSR